MLKNQKKIQQFKKLVWDYYRKHGRADLPWRRTTDPYSIVVSEIMLQQTQVPRVIEKYHVFLDTFPTVELLARAPLSKVLTLWSGLGYNRRARFLHDCAKAVVARYSGVFPKTKEELDTLPGIGPYTRSAVLAFAYNIPTECIETNIRSVFLHHFFSRTKRAVSDKELLVLVKDTLDTQHPREWYWALMDYGSFLKQQGNVVHRKSAQYKKQSAFKGSRREVRGAILKLLADKKKSALSQLQKLYDTALIDQALKGLIAEGFVIKKGSLYHLVD